MNGPGQMSEAGILESAAVVLAIAVACFAVARAEPATPSCGPTTASVSRDSGVPAKTTHEADATDMLLHD
ncbi:hypothetical protein [Mesorhizobium sp. INR15]|uniref:hypothetical protein n=1 Tax=Mesorhizobium sp. INR15 TaxID=2654248 RepID=UPI00189692C5|nr:hypothetical protein [Mesorhizobium sp. INR15]QPC91856.1 hypothetical protein GA829_15365 [Mesorhizobium sp. INR15]